ncbi:proclotting enzyme-like [Portunus trituberculatus]|uniref:proclotting enzyme-like n=1 Tax=Portunus trituberculatus TaxID=210409 RepID=UPI001E1D1F73|nr:proclotting enzyme-like [Portunus trituberculatus]
MVGVFVRRGGNRNYQLCGGSLLTTTHVLTAAHCVKEQGLSVSVGVGMHDLRDNTKEIVPVRSYKQHPHYDSGGHLNDVAILTLERAVTWRPGVGPICLAPDKNYEGNMAVVTGWGTLTYQGKTPNALHEVAVEIKTQDSCSQSYHHTTSLQIKESHVCAGSKGKDSCQGDSGGPLVVLEGQMVPAGCGELRDSLR